MANYGLLMVGMTPTEHGEGEFNSWYDAEHIPERLSAPGFLGARRWIANEAPTKYLALYDLESSAALHTPEYQAMSGENNTEWTKRVLADVTKSYRNVYEQIWPGQAAMLADAGALLTVAIDPDPNLEDDLNAWYQEEHIDLLLKVPGFLQARRFRAIEGSPKYLAIYDLASLDALKPSPELDRAVNTEWANRTRPTWQRVNRATYLPYSAEGSEASQHGELFESVDKGGISVTETMEGRGPIPEGQR